MFLNVVREIRERIVTTEAELANLRGLAGNLVPTLDGLPMARSLDSRVEKLGVKIVDAEAELDRLKAEFDKAAAELFDEIQRRVRSIELVAVLSLRFVSCLSFRQIARRMNYSVRQVFRLNQQGIFEFNNFEEESSCEK